MNTATQHQFKVGMRVEMTEEAIAQWMDGPHHRSIGTVMKLIPRAGLDFLRVRRDGFKGTNGDGTYHPDFWQPISPEAIAPNDRRCPTCGQKLP